MLNQVVVSFVGFFRTEFRTGARSEITLLKCLPPKTGALHKDFMHGKGFKLLGSLSIACHGITSEAPGLLTPFLFNLLWQLRMSESKTHF
jgi:hypothetical protein